MKRAATFEKVWHRVELGWTVAEVATGAAADLAAELEMADALRALGGSIEAPATAAAWTALQEKLDADVPVRRTHRGAPARAARTLLAIAAAFTLLVAVSLHAEPGSPLYGVRRGAEQVAVALSPNDGSLHLRLASARLGDLLETLSGGEYGQAPAIAGSLASERTAAMNGGADASALDAQIRVEVPPALIAAPLEVARAVEDELSGPLGGGADHPNGAGSAASGRGGTGNGGSRGGSSAGDDQASGGSGGTGGSSDGSQGSGTQGTQGGSGDGSQGDQGGSGDGSQGSGSQGDQSGSGDGSQGSGTGASPGGSSSQDGPGLLSDSQS